MVHSLNIAINTSTLRLYECNYFSHLSYTRERLKFASFFQRVVVAVLCSVYFLTAVRVIVVLSLLFLPFDIIFVMVIKVLFC